MRRPEGPGAASAEAVARFDRVRLTAWLLAAAGCTGIWAAVVVEVHALL